MRVRYLYSACIVIETADLSVCCDPWFTDGIYDGSWFKFPPLRDDPISLIGEMDMIYISHIHPDHYDVVFLQRYLDRFPNTRLLIGDTRPPYLANKMRADGFEPDVIRSLEVGDTALSIVPNAAFDEVDNIDTALVVTEGTSSVVNLNDNPIDPLQIATILDLCSGPPSVAFLPHSGAGPYPQTYAFRDEASLEEAAEQKKQQFLTLYGRYVELLNPRLAVPFAGQYFLGGPLMVLNARRGVADAVEAAQTRPDRSVVLADGGHSFIDVETLIPSETRDTVYAQEEVEGHLRSLPFCGYDYEREIVPLGGRSLPIRPLLALAYSRAVAHGCTAEPFWFCLSTDPGHHLCFNTAEDLGVVARTDVQDLEPRCEVAIDERYLFGLLTRLYHWNNAEIGSHYRSTRVPDVHRRDAYGFLHHLHV